MRVGMDISQTAFTGGVAVYTQNLATELSKIEGLEMSYFYSSLRKPYKGKLKNVKTFRLPPTLFEVFFNRARTTKIEKFIGPVDIFHSSDWVQPPADALKVTTYHDVIPLKYPEWSDPKIVKVHKKRLEIVEREIDMVIAVSEATKRDLMEVSKIPEEKIVVIYEGVEKGFKTLDKEQVEKFRTIYNLPEKFVLAFGGVGERKNLKRIKEASKEYKLVIAGEDIPWVTREQLPLLYNCADVLLYPSLYEGFGLPVLEAMACGVPVITANNSSLPEVGGEAVEYVDAEKTDEMKKKLREVMEDGVLRKRLIKDGLEQSKKFSWEKCAEETFKLYKNLEQA